MLKLSALAVLVTASVVIPSQQALTQAAPALLDPALQAKFVNPLPIPSVLDVRG